MTPRDSVREPAQPTELSRLGPTVLRDSGAALAVGGASVGLTILLTKATIGFDVFFALIALEYLLLVVGFEAIMRILSHMDVEVPWYVRYPGAAVPTFVLGTAVGVGGRSRYFPAQAFGAYWWFLVGASFLVAAAGVAYRYFGSEVLRDVDDERLQRIEDMLRRLLEQDRQPVAE